MRFRHKNQVLAALIAASFAAPVIATDQPAVSVLMEQARFWQSKGRGDLAAEAWQKILRVEPDNSEALYALGAIEIDSGRIEGAKEYLARLNRTHPSSPATRRLAEALQFHTIDKAQLDRARKLAHAGKYDESVAVYRSLFRGQAPSGDFALEYYYTLAGTEKGWDEARRGLEQLLKDYPNSPRHQLALAQVQTYREPTRRTGIRSLAQLSKRPEVSAAATDAWGKALVWLDARDADRPLFREYMAARPQDQSVKQRFADIGKTGPGRGGPVVLSARDLRIIQGFAALNRNNLDVATNNFERVLANSPRDRDAQGGMGVVRLRQERYKEAQTLLEQAAAGNRRWSTALNSATYWGLVDDAVKARSAHDNTTAKTALIRAIGVNGYELAAPNALGDVLVEEGDYRNGETMYRQVLQRQPNNGQALRGLFNALAGQQRGEEALALLKRIPPAEAEKLGGASALQSDAMRVQGLQAQASGNLFAARGAFNESLKLNPGNAWARLERARLDMAEGRTTDAWQAADELRKTASSVDAAYAGAMLYGELGSPQQGLALLESIPLKERTLPMSTLQRRMWVTTQAEEVTRLVQSGATQQAAQLAFQINRTAGDDADMMMTAAHAYAEVGDPVRGLAIARQAIVRIPPTAIGPRIQYASILQRTRQETEFVSVAQQLYAQPLSARQRADLDNLRAGYTLRQADLLREYGQPQRALDVLAPLAGERPTDLRVQAGVGRVLDSLGERERALTHYRYVVEQDPNNLDARVAAANAAIAAREYGVAQTHVNTALQQAPRDPQVLAAAGRLARAQGDFSRAAEYFRAAIEAQQSPRFAPTLVPPSRSMLEWVPSARLDEIEFDAAGVEASALGEATVAAADDVDDTDAAAEQADAEQSVDAADAGEAAQQVVEVLAQAPAMPAHVQAQFVHQAPVPLAPMVPSTATAPIVVQLQFVQNTNAAAATADGVNSSSAEVVAQASTQQPWPVQAQGVPVIPAPVQPAAVPAPVQVPIQIPVPQQGAAPAATIQGGAAPINIYIIVTPQGVQQAVPGQQIIVPQPQYIPVPMAPQQPAPRVAPAPRPVAPRVATPRPAAPVPARPVVRAAPVRPAPAAVAPAVAAPKEPPIVVPPLKPAAAPDPVPTTPVARPVERVIEPPAPSVAPSSASPAPAAPVIAQTVPRAGTLAAEAEAVQRELGEIEARRGSSVAAGVNLRNRSGEEGLGRMLEVEAPIEARIGVGYDQHIVLRAAGVYLDGGQLEAGNTQRIRRFGTNALGTAAGFQNSAQTDSGMAASLGYESNLLRADIGTTPIGFRIRNTVGGLRLHAPTGSNLRFLGELSRRAVNESILSFAGTRDDRTGQDWGGVVATGGKLGLTWDDGRVGWYGLGSYHRVTGDDVARNKRTGATGGFYVRWIDQPGQRLTAGADLTFYRFEKNLRNFTFGHGGYFSPQRYLALSLPVDWTARNGNLVYQLSASVGVQHFRENETPFYPDDPGLQSSLEGLVGTGVGLSRYGGQSKTGGIVGIGAAAEYQLASQFFLGGHLSFDNSRDYRQTIGGLYLRYSFVRMPQSSLLAPRPLRYTVGPY